MDPIKIIQKYYATDSKAYELLLGHSQAVAKKALEIAKRVPHLNPDLKFIEEAAMLHDIGCFLTNMPIIGCFGEKPYICHGYLGKEILEKEGFPKHAQVCETHVSVGLSIQDIEEKKLPIPKKEILKISIEEEIICFADKFFSKDEKDITQEKNIEKIREVLWKFNNNKLHIFDQWLEKFGE